MSSYSLSNSAPINNFGYYDVPIYNQYSNHQQNKPYRQITNHQFNHQVSDSYNNENAVYVLTCAHVVDNAKTIKIKMIPFGSDLYDCKLVSMIPCNLQEFSENFTT